MGEKIGSWVFFLIMAYLIISNAGAMNSIIQSGGGFLTGAFGVLQGRGLTGNIANPSYNGL